jgi:hypothetical protein
MNSRRFMPNMGISCSFDHLVGAGEYCRRDLEAERLGGLEVEEEYEVRRLDRQRGRAAPMMVHRGEAHNSGK